MNIKSYYGFPLDSKKKEKKPKKSIVQASSDGVFGALTGFYSAEVLKNIFLDNKRDLLEILMPHSTFPAYVGITGAGFFGGISSIFLIPIQTNAISVTLSSYGTDLARPLFGEEPVSRDFLVTFIVIDILVTSIIFAIVNFEESALSIEFSSLFITGFFVNLYYIYKEKTLNTIQNPFL